MTELDEDALLELHSRVRPARTKYVKLYRRQASARVAQHGGRGTAYARNQRDRDKAEVFELALARVSRRVDVVAKHAAAELRAERLEAARSNQGQPPSSPAPASAETKVTPRRKATKTTGGLKKDAVLKSSWSLTSGETGQPIATP